MFIIVRAPMPDAFFQNRLFFGMIKVKQSISLNECLQYKCIGWFRRFLQDINNGFFHFIIFCFSFSSLNILHFTFFSNNFRCLATFLLLLKPITAICNSLKQFEIYNKIKNINMFQTLKKIKSMHDKFNTVKNMSYSKSENKKLKLKKLNNFYKCFVTFVTIKHYFFLSLNFT